MKEEVDKSREIGVIEEVFKPEWLANTVEGMCGFHELKKACPKDQFLVPKID